MAKHEHNELLIAAKGPGKPVQGIGSYNFYFVGFAEKDLRRLLKLVRFVERWVGVEERKLGDQLAKDLMGPKATYARAQSAFHRVVHDEQMYPTKASKKRAAGQSRS